MINVDYNMGISIDFIDRELYLPFPKGGTVSAGNSGYPGVSGSSGIKSEGNLQQHANGTQNEAETLEKLRMLLLDEKDRFLLSERNTFETQVKKKDGDEDKLNPRLPARYVFIDKVHKWGVDIRDPLAVRQLSDEEESEDNIIMTSMTDKSKREVAIK